MTSRRHKNLHRGQDGVTMTFVYPDRMRTLVAASRRQCFERARELWGDGWIGEPSVSTPWSIYCDLSGETRTKHGGGLSSYWLMHTEGLRRSRLFRQGK